MRTFSAELDQLGGDAPGHGRVPLGMLRQEVPDCLAVDQIAVTPPACRSLAAWILLPSRKDNDARVAVDRCSACRDLFHHLVALGWRRLAVGRVGDRLDGDRLGSGLLGSHWISPVNEQTEGSVLVLFLAWATGSEQGKSLSFQRLMAQRGSGPEKSRSTGFFVPVDSRRQGNERIIAGRVINRAPTRWNVSARDAWEWGPVGWLG